MIGRSPNGDSSLWRVVLNDTEEESVRTRMKYSNYYYKRARARPETQRESCVTRYLNGRMCKTLLNEARYIRIFQRFV